jgi:predicted transcriptional regulator
MPLLATQKQYTFPMKSAVLPQVRVAPALRAEVEQCLAEGESLSQFVEGAVREAIERRRSQSDFVSRGLAGAEAARRSGAFFTAQQVADRLDAQLAQARQRLR